MVKTKKLAIVFDDLIQKGGAERLLCAVSEMFPGAPIYTSLATKEWLAYFSEKNIVVFNSFMQKIPFGVKLNRVMGFLGIHSLAFTSFNFDDYDLVFSMSSRFAHHIITKPDTTHICYINSPGRMFWEPLNYFANEEGLSRGFAKTLFSYLSFPFLSLGRARDYVFAQRVDQFIANSKTPQKRVEKYYRRTSDVVYPFHELAYVTDSEVTTSQDFFLIISRLQAWKKIDIAIKACENNSLKLKIIGEGPDIKRLKRMSNGSTQFLGRVSDSEKRSTLLACKALIMTQKEDFGITALEAMCVGKPVIAYGFGGVLETVQDGVTGTFYYEQSVQSLAEVLLKFDNCHYKSSACVEQAKKYSKELFEERIQQAICTKTNRLVADAL